MKFTIIVRYKFAPAWLRLSREERHERGSRFDALVELHRDRLTVRHHDAEAFASDYSDFLVIECDDIKDYYFFMEDLRDSEFIAEEWLGIHDITIGIPDGYKEFEKA